MPKPFRPITDMRGAGNFFFSSAEKFRRQLMEQFMQDLKDDGLPEEDISRFRALTNLFRFCLGIPDLGKSALDERGDKIAAAGMIWNELPADKNIPQRELREILERVELPDGSEPFTGATGEKPRVQRDKRMQKVQERLEALADMEARLAALENFPHVMNSLIIPAQLEMDVLNRQPSGQESTNAKDIKEREQGRQRSLGAIYRCRTELHNLVLNSHQLDVLFPASEPGERLRAAQAYRQFIDFDRQLAEFADLPGMPPLAMPETLAEVMQVEKSAGPGAQEPPR